MKLTSSSYLSYCRKGLFPLKALLLYGEEPYYLTPYLSKLFHTLSQDVKRYSASDFVKKKAFLKDILGGKDLFSKSSVTPLIEDVGDSSLPFIKSFLDENASYDSGPAVILTARYLKPSSKLRQFFERESKTGILGCFAPKLSELKAEILSLCNEQQIQIQATALDFLTQSLLESPYQLHSELNKIILFAHPSKTITLECIKDVVQNSLPEPVDDIALPLLSRNCSKLVTLYEKNYGRSQDVIGFIRRLSFTLLRFYTIKSLQEKGHSLPEASRKVYPPLSPFSLKTLQPYLGLWSPKTLLTYFHTISRLEVMCKKNYTLSETLLKQCLLSFFPQTDSHDSL